MEELKRTKRIIIYDSLVKGKNFWKTGLITCKKINSYKVGQKFHYIYDYESKIPDPELRVGVLLKNYKNRSLIKQLG